MSVKILLYKHNIRTILANLTTRHLQIKATDVDTILIKCCFLSKLKNLCLTFFTRGENKFLY
jgi:hypothetical protein